jgi:hypothetical protein
MRACSSGVRAGTLACSSILRRNQSRTVSSDRASPPPPPHDRPTATMRVSPVASSCARHARSSDARSSLHGEPPRVAEASMPAAMVSPEPASAPRAEPDLGRAGRRCPNHAAREKVEPTDG